MNKVIAFTLAAFLQALPANASLAGVDRGAFRLSVPAALSFRPDLWEPPKDRTLAAWYVYNANCYEYALGDKDLTLARFTNHPGPGEISGHHFETGTKTDKAFEQYVEKQAGLDGLQPTGKMLRPAKSTYPVALFIRSDSDVRDFHWLRLNGGTAPDSAGLWSQKFIGRHPAIVAYPDGTPVRDPAAVNISAYGIAYDARQSCENCYRFAGYFNVPLAGLPVPAKVVAQSFRDYARAYPGVFAQMHMSYRAYLRLNRFAVVVPRG